MQQKQLDSTDAHVQHVLRGLRPPIAIKGRPPVRGTLHERMEDLHVPGVSIAIIDGWQVAWAGGFGVKEAGTADRVTTSTLFQVASISKPVTASAALRLVEAGKLSLDDDVNGYLRSWKVHENSFTSQKKVTLRRILSHSAGVTVQGFAGYGDDETLPTLQQVLDGERPANNSAIRVDVTPDSLCRYSGGGFTILQQLLIDISGESFPSLLKGLVFDPVGMPLSTYEQPLPIDRLGEAARGHDAEGAVLRGNWHIYPEMAAAGLWTTPTELAKWVLEISTAWRGRASGLLLGTTAQQMLTLREVPPSPGFSLKSGLGLALQGEGDSFSFTHGGSNEGFMATFVMYPRLGKGAIVMTNADQGGTLFAEVLQSVAAEYQWPSGVQSEREVADLSEEQLEGLVGTYRALVTPVPGTPISCEVARDGRRLFIEMKAYSLKSEAYAASADSFFTTSGFGIQFTRDSSGRAVKAMVGALELAATTSSTRSSTS